MQLSSKIHVKISLKLKTPFFLSPQSFAPFLHPIYRTLILDFIPNLDPSPRYLKNKLEIFTCTLDPLESKMSFGAPYNYLNMDRHTDTNNTIYASLMWSYNPHI